MWGRLLIFTKASRPLTSPLAATRMAHNTPATPDCSSAPSPLPWLGCSLCLPSNSSGLTSQLLLGPSGFSADTTSSRKPPLTA